MLSQTKCEQGLVYHAFCRLDSYVQKHDYSGWDPFDALNAQLCLLPPFFCFRFFRLVWTQLFKRSPVNFRRIACVPTGHNPKGLALFASGYARIGRLETALELLNRLDREKYVAFESVGWGYNFPWQARAFYVPRHKPNMVVTAFVAQAMLDYYDLTKDPKWLELAHFCCNFIIENLILHEDRESACLGYIPGEPARVHNANLLGAALLMRMFTHVGVPRWQELSRKCVKYSMAALTPDFFWPYGERTHHGFVDSFHTGFNLTALKLWMDVSGEQDYRKSIEAAYRKYLDAFWLEDGTPKYYHNRHLPIDIHNSAQGVLTCLALQEHDERSLNYALKIISWAITNMQADDGCFFYQKTQWYTNRIAYMRWSQSWMFQALATYIADPNTLPIQHNPI